MAERIRNHVQSNVIGFLALFFALTGGVAWATHPGGANTISSADIINGEVKTADIGTGEVMGADVATANITATKLATDAVSSTKIVDGQVTIADIGNQAVGAGELVLGAVTNNRLANSAVNSNKIANGAILGIDLAANTVTGAQVDESTLFNDNSLTGGDIDESTLSGVPSTPTGPAGGDLAGTYPDPQIADAAVTIPKLDFDPATQGELDQLASDDGDGPNTGSNQLHWSRLGGVPAGIVDGDDDVDWELTGNAGTSGAEDFLGTTDDQPLNLRVDNARALRLEPASDGTNPSPNLIGGSPDNQVSDGVHSATIGGGGRADPGDPASANEVTDHQGTIGGGIDNQAGDDDADLNDERHATVGGGAFNTASGAAAAVAGGHTNTASGDSATVGGGQTNQAIGMAATVPGGLGNTAQANFSVAAGTGAQAIHDGAIVLGDSNLLPFPSTAQNQFSVRATGGTRLVAGIDGSGNTTSGLELPAGTSGWSTLVNGSPFDIRVNNARGLRVAPASDGTNQSPNLIGGIADNSVTAGVHSATIAGGGRGNPAFAGSANRVTDNYGTIGGGADNQAGDGAGNTSDRVAATVAGGAANRAQGNGSTVGGGQSNLATGINATVAGGLSNQASDAQATVAGGFDNLATNLRATVGGGISNRATGLRSTVAGGQSNQATGNDASVGGGANSFATGISATVPGGSGNEARADYSLAAGRRALAQPAHSGAFVWADSNNHQFSSTAANQFNVRATGGTRLVSGVDGTGAPTSGLELPANTSGLSTLVTGQPFEVRVNGARAFGIEPASQGTNQSPNMIGGAASNSVTTSVHSATIGGGGRGTAGDPASANLVTDHQGTVGGGANNQAGDDAGSASDRTLATVGGGGNNNATGEAATVGGGLGNIASGSRATVGGGNQNQATALRAVVGGGHNNRATDESATVGGGSNNLASALEATVSGGNSNTASGIDATVVGGFGNMAQGTSSLAGGQLAHANHDGAFVWADSNILPFPSSAPNQFSVRSTGGARFVSAIDVGTGAPTAGVQLAPGGGSWSSLSDEASKRAIEPVSGRSVLRKLTSVPVSTWSYRSQDDSIRHIGPMAQDFFRAFGVGEDRRRIASVDADGVALAAIKGLHRELQAERRRRHEQERRLARLEARLAALERGQ